MMIMAITAAVANFKILGVDNIYEEEKAKQSDSTVSISNPSPVSIVFFTFFYIFLVFYGSTWGPLGWVRCLLNIILVLKKEMIQYTAGFSSLL